MTDKQARKRIKEIGGDEGFWKSGTGQGLVLIYRELIQQGLPAHHAVETIENVFNLARGEYGD